MIIALYLHLATCICMAIYSVIKSERKNKKTISIFPPSFEYLYEICLYAAKQYSRQANQQQPVDSISCNKTRTQSAMHLYILARWTEKAGVGPGCLYIFSGFITMIM